MPLQLDKAESSLQSSRSSRLLLLGQAIPSVFRSGDEEDRTRKKIKIKTIDDIKRACPRSFAFVDLSQKFAQTEVTFDFFG